MKRDWTELPSGFGLDADLRNFARDRGFTDAEIDWEVRSFRDYHTANGTYFKDWRAAWRTWVLTEIKLRAKRRYRPVRSLDELVEIANRRPPKQMRFL